MTTLTALAIILVFFLMMILGLLSVLRDLLEKTHDEPEFSEADDGRVGNVSQPN